MGADVVYVTWIGVESINFIKKDFTQAMYVHWWSSLTGWERLTVLKLLYMDVGNEYKQMGGGWWKPDFSLLGWEFTNKLKKEVKWSIRGWMKVGNISMNSC